MPVHPVERKLAAIFAADIAGYSRLMERDEVGTLTRLKASRVIVDGLIASHRGRIFNTAGDSVVADFASAVDAVQCAVAVQAAITGDNAGGSADEPMLFRVGVHIGDVMVDGTNLLGDGVNIAARLEALAEPGAICVSAVVHDQVRDKLDLAFEDMGEQQIKNIARPVRVYALRPESDAYIPIPSTLPATSSPPRAAAQRLSIVVLPFANVSNDPEQEYFADGITDDLTTDLSRISDSFVISRTTAFTYKGKPVDAKQIGHELGVHYVLEGSIRRTGERVRINAQLIDAETGAHIWADRFDTDRANLDFAQDEITGRLAQTLCAELREAAVSQIERENPASLDARDLVMRGWAWFYRPVSPAQQQEALETFERALKLDPSSLGARVGIATMLNERLTLGWSQSRAPDIKRSEQLLLEVLDRDRNHGMARCEFGRLRRVQNRLEDSKIELEKAIALDNNDSRALNLLGITLLYLGQPEKSLPLLERSHRLNPRNQNIFYNYLWRGHCYLLLGQLDNAIEFLRKTLAGYPGYWNAVVYLAAAFGLRGDLDEARTALAEAFNLRPEVGSFSQLRATPYHQPWTNSQYVELRERTVYAGLRRAGMPEE